MSDSVSLENGDAWLVAVVVVCVIVISSRIASGRRAAGARRDEEGASALPLRAFVSCVGRAHQAHSGHTRLLHASRVSSMNRGSGVG